MRSIYDLKQGEVITVTEYSYSPSTDKYVLYTKEKPDYKDRLIVKRSQVHGALLVALGSTFKLRREGDYLIPAEGWERKREQLKKLFEG
jgi:hypothetical protein